MRTRNSENRNMNRPRAKNKKKKTQNKYKRITKFMEAKLAGFFMIILLVFIVLSGRLIYIKATDGEKYTKISILRQPYGNTTIPYKRGDILDRNGTVLATSDIAYNLILDPAIILSKAEYLEPTLDAIIFCFPDLKKEELRTDIMDRSNSHYYVVAEKKYLSYEMTVAMNEILDNKKEHPFVKGIWFEETYKRRYPYNTLASSVIGFTEGTEGAMGIENSYNAYLKGTNGRKFGYVDEDNKMDPVLRKCVNGQTVVSTIDFTLQNICEKWIKAWKTEYNPARVAVVMADPNNGEILAMADDNSSFDLNEHDDVKDFYTQEEIQEAEEKAKKEAEEKGEDIKDWKSELLYKKWRNYCISDSYEAGSTIKPFTVATALEESKITQSQTFMCDGHEEVGGFRIHCHKRSGHGPQTTEQAIMNSCNDALMSMAFLTGKDLFCEYQSRFGFGMHTNIDLPFEASCAGLLFTPDNMADSSLATNSFGQNFNVTMVQMVAGFSALINGGNYYQPHVVKQILNADGGVAKNIDDTVIKQVVTKGTSDFLRHAMWQTTEAGTGKTAKVVGYRVGGKTGTAQHIDKTEDIYLLSFLGFAPYENPQVVCYVIVDVPQVEDKASSSYASRLFSAIMTEALPYLNIFPEEPVVSEPSTDVVPLPEQPEAPQPEQPEASQPEAPQPEAPQQDASVPDAGTTDGEQPSYSPSEDENYEEGGIIESENPEDAPDDGA